MSQGGIPIWGPGGHPIYPPEPWNGSDRQIAEQKKIKNIGNSASLEAYINGQVSRLNAGQYALATSEQYQANLEALSNIIFARLFGFPFTPRNDKERQMEIERTADYIAKTQKKIDYIDQICTVVDGGSGINLAFQGTSYNNLL